MTECMLHITTMNTQVSDSGAYPATLRLDCPRCGVSTCRREHTPTLMNKAIDWMIGPFTTAGQPDNGYRYRCTACRHIVASTHMPDDTAPATAARWEERGWFLVEPYNDGQRRR